MGATRSLNQQRLLGDGINPSAIQIAIDWDPTALHLRYQSTRERVSIMCFQQKHKQECLETNRVHFNFHHLDLDRRRVAGVVPKTAS